MDSKLKEILADLDREILRAHRSDTALFAELTEVQRAAGILHGNRPISPFFRPYFLEASRYSAIKSAARAVSSAFESLTRAALETPELMRRLALTEAEERFARFEPGYRAVSVTSRLDTFLNSDGFKFLEYNAETPAGVGDQHGLKSLVARIPLVRKFLENNPHYFPEPHIRLLQALDAAYREYGGRKEKPNIAIVDWSGVDTAPEFEVLRVHFESCGYSSRVLDPSDLEFDGGVLRSGDFEVDIFYKRLVIHEFLQRFDDTHPIARAVSQNAVCMANSFRSKIPHKKSGFAILSDDRYHSLFSPVQLEVIQKHIPWTRLIEDTRTSFQNRDTELLTLLRDDKYRFVIKPVDDYGGKGVVIGWEASESEWDDAIEQALYLPFVVQERAGVEKTEIPVFRDGETRMENLTVDFDPFLFMGEVEGGMVRLAPGPLVNITQGGGEAALAIFEGL